MKKKEKVPSFPGFCIKYCAGHCSILTVCRFPVSFVAHSCLLCHALHIAQSPSSLHCWMPDVHTAINMGGPILGSCPPILCRCLTRQLLISSMAPNMFFLSVFCPREMTAGDFHLKEGRSGIAPQPEIFILPTKHSWEPKMPLSSSRSPLSSETIPWELKG